MLQNHFKIALRNLQRRRAYALVNILGLTLGIAAVILIFTLVSYHLRFDTFHTNKDRVYRVLTAVQGKQAGYTPGVPPPLGKALIQDYTYVERAGNVAAFKDQLISLPLFQDGLKFQEPAGVAFAEPAFFEILDYPLVQGDKKTLLAGPNTAVITQRLARKYFGGHDPIGQVLRLTNRFNNSKLDFRITGILRDLPVHTDRKQEIYLSYENLESFHSGFADDNWHQTSSLLQCFLLLKPGISPATVDGVFPAVSRKHYKQQEHNFQFKLQPLSDIHFNIAIDGAIDKKHLWALSLIGVFLIITACVNFINLATAQALSRSKEIGVRKALGSRRAQLFWQFMSETAVIATVALLLAFLLAWLALPYVNRLFNTELSLHLFRNAALLAFLPVLLAVVILLAGAYPGLMLAGFQPVAALRGRVSQKQVGGFSLRKGLVITQFAISQLLIISTLVITNQMRYSRQSDMGFQQDAIVMLPVPVRSAAARLSLDAQLKTVAGVESMTFFSEEPAGNETYRTRILLGGRSRPEDFDLYFKPADERYVPTFGLQMAAGRNLRLPLEKDTLREYLLNETAVRMLGLSSPETAIGQTARVDGRKGIIVGVLKDFHNRSFHESIQPLCITTGPDWYGRCAVKAAPGALKKLLPVIESAWSKAFPDHVFRYDFLDERIARLYQVDTLLLRLIQAFAAIAILIGCLGLYGLVSFMAAQKTKEVGIRKVLGASVENILWLFGREFTRLLLIAFIIAAPPAWWLMQGWLQNFVYRVGIGPGVFALAIAVTLLVSLCSVGVTAARAALMNPVRSLKAE